MKTSFTTAVTVQTEKFTVLSGSTLTRISPTLKLSSGLAGAASGFEVRTQDIPELLELLKAAQTKLTQAETALTSL